MKSHRRLVVSCHADTGFKTHRLSLNKAGLFYGHLDNFVGVHAVMKAFFSGRLDRPRVRIELTYGEETDMAGAFEVLETLEPSDVVIVVDVTATPTSKEIVIEKCKDPLLRRFVKKTLAGLSFDLYAGCPDPVSDLDETDVYRHRCSQVLFLGIPCWGGDYNRGRVYCRPGSIDAAAEALIRIAGQLANLTER
jgi:hypothetical protein